MLPANYVHASGWGLSLAPNAGWRTHWDNAEFKEGSVLETGRGYIGVDRLDGSGSSLTSRIVNSGGAVRTGRVAVNRGGCKDYPEPAVWNDEMQDGYKYTPSMYNNNSVNRYIWASGYWSPNS